MPIHSSGQTVFRLAPIEGITLGAGEEVDEVAGGASGMDDCEHEREREREREVIERKRSKIEHIDLNCR